MTGRAVVIGGGVAGLTVAYRLASAADAPAVTVLEADARVGGKLRSVEVGGLPLEAGADSFVARKPWAVELCRELGLGRELVPPGSTGAWLWTDAGLVRLPADAAFGIPGDVGDVFHWPGLSGRGRRRALRDLLIRKRRGDGDESLGALLRRRLGDEATDLAVGPLLAGLFAGDVDRLSVRATFPELERWEAYQGSLIRGSQAARRSVKKSEPGPMFLKLKGGTRTLTDRLAAGLGAAVRTGTRAVTVQQGPGGLEVHLAGTSERLAADVVVVATPAFAAADLLTDVAPPAAADLASIPYASTGVVFLVYPEGTQRALPDGTGFVVPRGRAPMTACTWLSKKWPNDRYGTRAVVRCYVGSAGDDEVVDAPDADLVRACETHLAALVDLPPRAEHTGVVRWHRSMPQYEVDHLERVARIRSGLPAGIFVTGSALDGVGIPDCVRAAGETAALALAHLAGAKETIR